MRVGFIGPRRIELEYDREGLRKRIGNEIANKARDQLASGRSVTGKPLPRGTDGGPALKDSGQLIASIKYHRGSVRPTGSRRDGGARTNERLLAILLWQHENGRRKRVSDRGLRKARKGGFGSLDKSGRVRLTIAGGGGLRRAHGGELNPMSTGEAELLDLLKDVTSKELEATSIKPRVALTEYRKT